MESNIVDFSSLDSATQDLVRKGVSARELAYCPYSKFPVGAALLCSDGTVYTGCNVENSSYGLSICAERTAIVKAVSSGNKKHKAIVVSASQGDTFVSPCDSATQELVRKSVSARELAYCPYSKFQVGAALLCSDGSVFTGCNVEDVAFSPTVCAERTAIVKAVSSGNKSFKAIVVSASNGDTFVSPCGVCRQFISEFGSEIDVYLAKPDLSKVLITSIKELLPLSFKL